MERTGGLAFAQLTFKIIEPVLYTQIRPRPRTARGRACQTSAAAHQHPRRLLLSVKERNRDVLTHPTLDQMQALGLGGMATAYRELAEQNNADDLSRDEWLGLMLDREAAIRADKRLSNRIAAARLRFADACVENIDFAAHRGLDRRNTLSLAQGAWLKAHENLIVTGQTGTGKTWLACAFGRQAARLDHSVLYLRMPRLFEDLGLARLDGRFSRLGPHNPGARNVRSILLANLRFVVRRHLRHPT